MVSIMALRTAHGRTPRPMSAPRRRRLWPMWLGAILALVFLAVAGELLARSLTGELAERELLQRLPTESGIELDVRPTGTCVLCELVGRELSGLDIDGQRVRLGDALGELTMHAADVAIDDPVTIGAAHGTLRVNEQEFNALLDDAAARAGFTVDDVDLRQDRLAYRASTEIVGVQVGLDVTASINLLGDGRVRFAAEEVALVSGPVQADLPLDLSRFSLEVCVARVLPAVLEVDSIQIEEDSLAIEFSSTRAFRAGAASFRTLGNC